MRGPPSGQHYSAPWRESGTLFPQELEQGMYPSRNFLRALVVSLGMAGISGCSREADTSSVGSGPALGEQRPTGGGYATVPYLGELRDTLLYGDIWERPQLSKRDRSMITIAVLQALYRDQLRGHIGSALDNGLTQEEIAEVILHVTFYSSWPTGVNAAGMARDVFMDRGLPVDGIGPSAHQPPPPDMEMPQYTSGAYAAVPYLGELRNRVLFGDIWERPELSKRDRSMITVAVAQAMYATSELRVHIGRALDDNGVTQEEIAEVILHTTFYGGGWPGAVNAGGVAAQLFEERGLPLGK